MVSIIILNKFMFFFHCLHTPSDTLGNSRVSTPSDYFHASQHKYRTYESEKLSNIGKSPFFENALFYFNRDKIPVIYTVLDLKPLHLKRRESENV